LCSRYNPITSQDNPEQRKGAPSDHETDCFFLHYEGRGRVGGARQALADVDYAFDVIYPLGAAPYLVGEITFEAGTPDLPADGLQLRLQLEDGQHVSIMLAGMEVSFEAEGSVTYEIRAAPEQAGSQNIMR